MCRVRVLTGEEIAALLDLEALIDALGPAMADLSAGRASVPNRIGAVVPKVDGRLMAMSGHVPSQGARDQARHTLSPQCRELPADARWSGTSGWTPART
jgi:alanine dehydrogenase